MNDITTSTSGNEYYDVKQARPLAALNTTTKQPPLRSSLLFIE
jgi:hypothetical protein